MAEFEISICGKDLGICPASCILRDTTGLDVASRLKEEVGMDWPKKLHHKWGSNQRDQVLSELEDAFPDLKNWCLRRKR